MYPEKEIVALWLNQLGYLVITDINAGKNKLVDCLAFKLKKGKLEEAYHIEVSVSVASVTETLDKFNDELVQRAIKKKLSEFSSETSYKKMLITTTPYIETKQEIEMVSFEKVLIDFLAKLDRKNYSSNVVRTLQLLKFILLCSPAEFAELIKKFRKASQISNQQLQELVALLLKLEEAKKVFSKHKNKKIAEECFSNSVLVKPEELAGFVVSSLTTRGFNSFLRELFSYEKAKQFTKKKSPKQKTLRVFLE